jgi:hypothetical protein
MRNLLLLLPILLLTSCSSLQFRYATLNYAASVDGIYSSQPIQVDVIDNDWDFARKLRNDWNFRQNFAWFAQNQDIGWYYRNYNYLGGWRSGVSPFDMYMNAPEMWFDWSMNYPFHMWNGFRNRDMLGFGATYSWNNNRWSSNFWGMNNPWNFNRWNGYLNGYGWGRWNRLPNHRNPNYRRNEIINRPVVRTRGRRGSTNTQVRPVRTRSNNQLDNDIRRLRNNNVKVRVINDVREGRRVVPNSNTPKRVIQRPNTRTPQRTQVRQPQPPQRTQVREAVKQTQPTRRSSNVVIKNQRNH